MDLPLVERDSVVHIGSFDPSDKGKHGPSWEGHGLSVSTCPKEWERIAKLGGYPWWQMKKEGACFVDAHALSKAQHKAISDWGVEQGYVERVTVWNVLWYDDEIGDQVRFILASKEDAELEAEALPDAEIKRGRELKSAPKLEQLIGQKADLGCFDLLLIAYVELETDLDGVHWADLNDGYLSAPRSVILPTRVAEWQAEKVYEPRPGLKSIEDPAREAVLESLYDPELGL